MSPSYGSAESFRQALTDRLRREAARRGLPVETLRTKVFIERLLARHFHEPSAPWLLKGGYSFELRYRPRARTTRDIDLGMDVVAAEGSAERASRVRDELQRAAERDLGDHIVFRIGRARKELQGAPGGGTTFPVEALIAGKRCADFHVDVGFGDAMTGAADVLVGDDFLAFADVPPARVRSISIEQQFAEKTHAYTLEWTGRENSRVKDLVDLLVLIDRADLDPASTRRAVEATFRARGTHPVPRELPPPPASWHGEFATLAEEARLHVTDSDAAHRERNSFWSSLRAT